MNNYKSCLDYEIDNQEPNLDEMIDEELAEVAFNNHMNDIAEMIEEYGDYIGEDM